MLHIAAAALLPACVAQELDGSWRHPSATEVPSGGLAYELALGQYGPEVAGLVWFYQGVLSGDAADPYLFPVHCTPIEDGVVRGASLRFRFRDPEGAPLIALLEIADGRDVLTGQFIEEDGKLRVVRFSHVSDDVDRSCGLRADPFAIEGVLVGDRETLPGSTRIVLAFAGPAGGGAFVTPWKTAALEWPDEGSPTFSFELATVPDAQAYAVATTDGTVRFAYAVFFAFDDLDGDGRWDRNLVGDDEPVVGVAQNMALVYLEGRGAAVFPDRPELTGALEPGYSLVSVGRRADGRVETLEPTDVRTVQVVAPPPEVGIPLLDSDG